MSRMPKHTAPNVGDTVRIKETGVVGVIGYRMDSDAYAVSYRLGSAHFTSTFSADELVVIAKATVRHE